MSDILLEIKDLYVEYNTMEGSVKAVNGLNFFLKKGEAVGLVGETGAGKTTTAVSILGLLPKRTARIPKGNIYYEGRDLLTNEGKKYLKNILGNKISMVFQNPLTSLNPLFTVGEQVAMVFRQHFKMNKKTSLTKASELLEVVGIPSYRITDFPHQFSGGMRQRVGIAAALACNPDLLIADEPTTALDVTIQAQVLELMKALQKERSTSLILITHNLGIVAELCERVAVMYSGRIIEYGKVDDVFNNPRHPYTRGLIGSLPDINVKTDRLSPILGSMPNPMFLPSGCKFASRCTCKTTICEKSEPPEQLISEDHMVACFEGLRNEDNSDE